MRWSSKWFLPFVSKVRFLVCLVSPPLCSSVGLELAPGSHSTCLPVKWQMKFLTLSSNPKLLQVPQLVAFCIENMEKNPILAGLVLYKNPHSWEKSLLLTNYDAFYKYHWWAKRNPVPHIFTSINDCMLGLTTNNYLTKIYSTPKVSNYKNKWSVWRVNQLLKIEPQQSSDQILTSLPSMIQAYSLWI